MEWVYADYKLPTEDLGQFFVVKTRKNAEKEKEKEKEKFASGPEDYEWKMHYRLKGKYYVKEEYQKRGINTPCKQVLICEDLTDASKLYFLILKQDGSIEVK
jgi:hypothetical protein